MFNVEWIGRYDAVNISRAVEDGGVGSAIREYTGGPFQKTVTVKEKLRQCSDERVDFETGFFGIFIEKVEEKNRDEGNEDKCWKREEFHGWEFWEEDANDEIY